MNAQSPHNLPEQPNALLGRADELTVAHELLLADNVRLLTLTGPPGVGKTRLAMALAENTLDAFPEGVWFIDLSPLRDPALVAPQIAATFDLAMVREETALDSLITFLNGRQMLLLLDNFEGVLPAATLIGKLLEGASEVKILTTSRDRLRLRWEQMMVVPPLSLPDRDLSRDPVALMKNPSIALFVERARAVRADFSLSEENVQIIATLCRRLDGIPLAIELAAARASVLSPAEILAHLDDRFRLLDMGALDLPERHRSLQAAIDWSYESLDPAEGQFLRRLSVFSGGFSRTAAEVVGDCQTLGLDGLQSLIALVEKGLVNRARGPARETRFTLFESIREYLLDRLQASGGLEEARRQHASFFLELAEWSYSQRKKANQKERFDILEVEHDNLRAALQWTVDTGEHSSGKRIAAALWMPFWWLRGHIPEGMRWLEIFRNSRGEPQDEIDLRLTEGVGMLCGWQGHYERGRPLLMNALRIALEREDEEAIIRVLTSLGWIFWVNGRTEEAGWLAERMAACSPNVDPWDLAYAYLSLGCLQVEAGQDDVARQSFARSLEHFQLAEGRQGAISARSKLALLQAAKGDFQKAQEDMINALEAAKHSIDLHVITYCVDDAVRLVSRRISEENIAQVPDLKKTVRILGAVDYWREIRSLPRTPRETIGYEQMTASLQQHMGEATYLRAWRNGRSIAVDQIIDEVSELVETSYRPAGKEDQLPVVDRITIALSNRERQVLGLIAQGLSNQGIGEHLFITERTVRYHVTSIFNKLGANNRAQAVAIATRLGLL